MKLLEFKLKSCCLFTHVVTPNLLPSQLIYILVYTNDTTQQKTYATNWKGILQNQLFVIYCSSLTTRVLSFWIEETIESVTKFYIVNYHSSKTNCQLSLFKNKRLNEFVWTKYVSVATKQSSNDFCADAVFIINLRKTDFKFINHFCWP